jgi:hypothetical protein
VFRACPKLRELSLSYNAFEHLDSESFRDVAGSLESLEISFGLRGKVFPEQVERLRNHPVKPILISTFFIFSLDLDIYLTQTELT